MSAVYATFRYFNALVSQKPRAKTRTLLLVSNSGGSHLGEIKWYGAWRKYCFFPNPNTVWSDDCLADVRALTEQLEQERAAA